MSGPVRRIGATYRLQIRDIGFAGAVALIPYLVSLGVETLYLSPIFTARAGSSHGYDIVDPVEIDPAIGGAAGYAALLEAADGAGLGVLLDIVPNHLAIDPANAYFDGALRDGPDGPDGAMFDVDWSDADGKIVLTTLDRPLADTLATGSVSIDPDGEAVTTPRRRYPLAHPILATDGERAPGIVAEVLDAQHYRLAYWRLRTSELNYRRFFEIDDLIALRQEDPAVYRATHALALQLGADRRVTGVRIDHVDGLTDPAGYLRRLTGDLASGGDDRPSVLVEKILGPGEVLPRWPIEGTTGYEFARLVIGLFVDPEGAATLGEEYRVRSGDPRPFSERQRDGKRRALDELFPAQLDRTVTPLGRVIGSVHPGSDVARADLTEAVRAIICALGVYRTYGVGSAPMARRDVVVLNDALALVEAGADREVSRAAKLLAGIVNGGVTPPSSEFADARRRFQQLASSVMAKGSEDTALFDPGTALVGAEVGGRPDAPAVTVEQFHRAMADRARRPAGLNATSTHDTKRSEDVRARLAVLTEEPSQWLLSIDRWRRAHERHRGRCDAADEIYLYETIVGLATPGHTTAPGFRRRIVDHVEKAAREAKRNTSWADPDVAYERDLRHLAEAVLSSRNATFHRGLGRILDRIVAAAQANALGVTVVKIAAPGVPDIYQGTEAGIASLTDPDNRRDVPFGALARVLAATSDRSRRSRRYPAPSSAVPDARKLAVTAAALAARRRDPELFDRGRYVPIGVQGERGDHLVGFARVRGRRAALALVSRLSAGVPIASGTVVARAWGDTRLDLPAGLEGTFRDALSGAQFSLGPDSPVAPLLSALPVALLIRDPTAAESV